MTLFQASELLRAARASRGAERTLLASRLAELLAEPGRLDHELENEVRDLVTAEKLPLPRSALLDQLIPGETYVLLYHPTLCDAGWLRAAPSSRPGLDGVGFDRRALSALRAARTGLTAFLHRTGCGLPAGFLDRGLALHVDTRTAHCARIDGPSLGLPAAVVILSLLLGTPARADVAGTAEVLPSGRLHPIDRVPEKLRLLARRFPHVRTVVVAQDQPSCECPAGIQLVRCADLSVALEQFGLRPEHHRLAPLSRKALCVRLNEFEHVVVERNDSGEWLGWAERAAAVANSPALSEEERARAWGWAALFSLHAGDADTAAAYRSHIAAGLIDRLSPRTKAWVLIGEATGAIDTLPTAAALAAARALRVARSELPAEDQPHLLGRAAGTLGRALMHAGRLRLALPALQFAVRFHAEQFPEEQPRSSVYLATCLRLAGETPQALALLQEASRCLRTQPGEEASVTTTFLLLERGRCRMTVGDFAAARRDFEVVMDRQDDDSDYPRLGALRGLARSLRHLARTAAAHELLQRCLAVAERGRYSIVRQIAIVAAGEALLDAAQGIAVGMSAERLWQSWLAVYPGPVDLPGVAAYVQRAVY